MEHIAFLTQGLHQFKILAHRLLAATTVNWLACQADAQGHCASSAAAARHPAYVEPLPQDSMSRLRFAEWLTPACTGRCPLDPVRPPDRTKRGPDRPRTRVSTS